ncbi:hypothetical protein H072_2987 [Dactylellina haptotyla CBS 200.50]|uniref:NADH-ubiquinone oxidoreductase n=1 Tax=Dactylellina haptotyla (strain CBS 200.50) TaxID=1284197 RepID=S8BU75_DACHA|nr:hypothetical protein H072_2987 [Dactylellina haptotyla CBS 200.50]
MGDREPRFNQHVLVDAVPLPDHIPKVDEVGASSAPLLSAAFFIGARCRSYNDDYMKCKDESPGRGEVDCMREGRKVTRCAVSVLEDLNTHCLEQFRAHWDCLERRNHLLWKCRKQEWPLNACVFEKLGLEKTIPGTPEGQIPVHQRTKVKYS